MKVILPMAAALFSIASITHAEAEKSCVNLHANDDRLACYDQLSGYVPSVAENAPASEALAKEDESQEAWVFYEKKDPFSDQETSFVALDAEVGSAVGSDAPETLVIRCSTKGTPEVYMTLDGYVGGDRVPVKFKFANGETVSERWSPSTNGTAAFLPSGYKDFLSGIESGEGFVFQVKDFRGSQSHASFSRNVDKTGKLAYVLNNCKD